MPKKKFMFTESADLANFNYKGIYVSLTIDIRKWAVTKRDEAGHPLEHDQLQELLIVLRITKDSKRLYLPIGEKCKWNDWLEMCKHEQSTRVRSDSEKRAQLKKYITNLKPIVYEMADAGTFSLARIKDRYNGISNDDVTIYTIWDEYIQEKKNEGEFGTAGVDKDTRNRFIRDNGREVKFSEINFDFVQDWVRKMQKAKLSTTYIGINLRTFRTMVNRAIRKGYVKGNTEEMFKDSGYNQMESRKDCFMAVTVFQQLYEFWEKGEAKDENGKELSMAHSSNNDITSNYIGSYPLPKMQEYNSYLLKIPQTVNSTEDLLNILKAMSEEERAALMEEASK